MHAATHSPKRIEPASPARPTSRRARDQRPSSQQARGVPQILKPNNALRIAAKRYLTGNRKFPDPKATVVEVRNWLATGELPARCR